MITSLHCTSTCAKALASGPTDRRLGWNFHIPPLSFTQARLQTSFPLKASSTYTPLPTHTHSASANVCVREKGGKKDCPSREIKKEDLEKQHVQICVIFCCMTTQLRCPSEEETECGSRRGGLSIFDHSADQKRSGRLVSGMFSRKQGRVQRRVKHSRSRPSLAPPLKLQS